MDNKEKQPLASEMTLLDYFAAQYMVSMETGKVLYCAKHIAEESYQAAAAMIDERKKYIKP